MWGKKRGGGEKQRTCFGLGVVARHLLLEGRARGVQSVHGLHYLRVPILDLDQTCAGGDVGLWARAVQRVGCHWLPIPMAHLPLPPARVGKPPQGLGVCAWMHPVNGKGNSPSPGRPTPGVVKQDKSSGGSVDTTKTGSGPQRVRMSSGQRPIGAAKGGQSDRGLVPTPPPPPPGGADL